MPSAKPFPRAAILCIVLSLLLALVVGTRSVRLLRIPTAGMSPTIPAGTLVPAHRPLSRDFQRGEVVIFNPPASGTHADPETLYIQRIAAIPGDRIDRNRDDHLTINGEVVRSPDDSNYRALPPIVIASRFPGAPRLPMTVPPGHYFMLGDNAGNSLDSRYFGTVEGSSIRLVPLRHYGP